MFVALKGKRGSNDHLKNHINIPLGDFVLPPSPLYEAFKEPTEQF